jgi:hypothetical protein
VVNAARGLAGRPFGSPLGDTDIAPEELWELRTRVNHFATGESMARRLEHDHHHALRVAAISVNSSMRSTKSSYSIARAAHG